MVPPVRRLVSGLPLIIRLTSGSLGGCIAQGLSRERVRLARTDLGVFADLVGWPLESWQQEALRLEKKHSILVSPRQCGKSRSLSVLAVWWAFRKPKQLVLVISAGDEAAGRLLRTMQEVTAHPLLSGSVLDETQHRIVLSNGSEIRSVPASERQVRGWSTDLLLIDEASFVTDDLILGAALPTVAARPDGRVVLASSPWGDSGAFRTLAEAGQDPGNPHTATFQWKTADAWWISPATIEAARATMSDLRFRAEYLGEWVPSGSAFFSSDDLRAAVADFPMVSDGCGMPASAGLDWGRRQDSHAVVLAGLLDDFGANGRPVVVVPWVEVSRRPYAAQVDEVVRLAGMWDLTITSETNGVGAMPTESLAQRLPYTLVRPSSSNQSNKEDAYGRVAVLLAERALVLPQHPELLRQMAGVTATPTPSGGLRIGARVESIHDDAPDALSLAVAALPLRLADVPVRDVPEGVEWVVSPAGVQVPIPLRMMHPEIDWSQVYAVPDEVPSGPGGGVAGDRAAVARRNPWMDVYAAPADETPKRLSALQSLPGQRSTLGSRAGV